MLLPKENSSSEGPHAGSRRPTGLIIAAALVIPALFTFLYRTLGMLGLLISTVVILAIGIPVVMRTRRHSRSIRPETGDTTTRRSEDGSN